MSDFSGSDPMFIQCGFTSTETLRLITDQQPRTATSTFTQFLSSEPYVVDEMLKSKN